MSEQVEMRPAYQWTCPGCGKDSFEAAVVPELTDDDKDHMRQEHGVEPWETGHFMTYPEMVVCSHCGLPFETEAFTEDADDETERDE